MFVVVCLLFVIFFPLFPIGEKVPFSLLKRLLPENPIILEAGAQHGEDTRWMSEMWSRGTIHAFEPLPESFEQLALVAAEYKNIHIYRLALSDQCGLLPFYVSGGASSLLQPTESFNNDYFHADIEHPIMVESITMDQWAQNNNVDHIDFLWLDMEGNELRALQSGKEIVKTVTVIYTEINLQPFWNGCVLYDELKRWLEMQGFEEIWVDIVPTWHGNALFVRKNE
jgi:2-O-methyltransferase